MSVDTAPQTKPPRGRFPFLMVLSVIVLVLAGGVIWIERNDHEKELASLRAEILKLRTEAEALKTRQRSHEHEVAAKSKSEPAKAAK